MEKRLKRAVIKEELVALTGDFVKAVLLQQLIYWTERVKDYDVYIKQEKERIQRNGVEFDFDLTAAGWIYKKAEELSEETMLGLSPATIRNHLQKLIDMGFVSQRQNPRYKWDRTFQYRVNLFWVATKLQELGYHLDGYAFLVHDINDNVCSNAILNTKNAILETKNQTQDFKNQTQDFKNQTIKNFRAIPEITTETTTEITTETTNRYTEPVANTQLTLGDYTETEQPNSIIKTSTKSKQKKQQTDTIFENYSNGNQDLLKALKDFEEMRKSIKSPIKTDMAKNLLLNELDRLAGNNDCLKIAILNQSILNGWKSVYQLKNSYYQQPPNQRVGDNNAYLKAMNESL